MIYILIIIYLLFVAYNMEYRDGIKFSKASYFAEWVVLTLLFGLRYRVGGDTLGYEEEFRTLPQLEEYFRYGYDFYPYQPFWYILNGVIKKVWDNFFFFQTIHCAFINAVFFYVFRKQSKIPFTCITIYFIFIYPYFVTEIIRESIAVAFFALSVDSLAKSKFLKYYMIAIVAFMFHASAAILFFIPPLYALFFKMKKHQYLLIVVVSILLMLSSLLVLKVIENITGLDTVSAGKFLRYNEQAETMNINGIMMPVLSFLFGLIILKIIKTERYHTQEWLSIMVCFFLVFTLCRVIYDTIMQRFANYMMPFFYLSFSSVIFDYIQNKKKEVIIIPVLSFFFLIQFHFYFHYSPMYTFGNEKVSSIHRYYPYYSVFDMQKDEIRERMIYCLDVNTEYEQPLKK